MDIEPKHQVGTGKRDMRWKVSPGAQRGQPAGQVGTGHTGSVAVVTYSCQVDKSDQTRGVQRFWAGGSTSYGEGRVDPERQAVCKKWRGKKSRYGHARESGRRTVVSVPEQREQGQLRGSPDVNPSRGRGGGMW